MVIFAEKQSFGYGQSKSDPLEEEEKTHSWTYSIRHLDKFGFGQKNPGFETLHMDYIFQPNLVKPKK